MAVKPNKKGVVTGTKYNDKITWTNSSLWKKALTVNGGAGKDVINFKKSKYKNKLYGGTSGDKIYGGSGNEYISGGSGSDLMYGYNGNDKIYGGTGNDKIYGGNGHDYINAGTGNDWVDGGAGNDTILGYSGKNKLYGGSGADIIKGGTGNDYIEGGTYGDKIYGNGGHDIIYGGSAADYISAGIGNDWVDGGTGNDTIYGGAGNDTIKGGKGKDQIWGGAGNDVIYGNYDTNTLKGEAGNDKIYGGTGTDNIYAGSGNDYVDGGAGNDNIYGESGTNTLIGGKGTDKLYSGTGVDTFKFASGDGADTIYNATSLDKIEFTGAVDDLFYIIDNNDLIINRKTGDKTDTVRISNYLNATDKIDSIRYNGEDKSISANKTYRVTGDGEELKGSERNEEVIATANTKDIVAGAGDDIIDLTNSTGVTIHIKDGDGTDTIKNLSENDTLYFEDISTYLKYREEYDQDKKTLTLRANDTDFLVIEDYPNSSSQDAKIKLGDKEAQTLIQYLSGYTKRFVIGTDEDDCLLDKCGYVYGGEGNDTITAGTAYDTYIMGGKGNDYITGGNAYNNYYALKGEDGDDIIKGLSGRNYIDGGNGNDTLFAGYYSSTVHGGNGDDIIYGHVSNSVEPSYLYGDDGNDTIYTGSKTLIMGGKGDDIIIRNDEDYAYHIWYYVDKNGDGNDTIYDYLPSLGYKSFIQFQKYSDEENKYVALSEDEQDEFINSLKYEVSGNDLIIKYGENYNNSMTFKGHISLGSENRETLLIAKTGTGYDNYPNLKDIVSEKFGDKILFGDSNGLTYDMSNASNSSYDTVIAYGGNDTIKTVANKSIFVDAGKGSNTINSYGNDTIWVDKEATDTINLYGANQEKTVVVQTGSKAIIKNVMNLTNNDSSKNPLVINFADQDFSNGDVMVYHNSNGEDGLHFVTRHNGLDVEVTGIYDGSDTNYLLDTDGKLPFAKFAITDKNGNGANIRELTNYWDMANHSNGFYSEYSAIVGGNGGQGGSQDWFIDGTTNADDYETIIPSDRKIDIYDIGGNDTLSFDSSSISGANSINGSAGYSVFFDVSITREDDIFVKSSEFGNDLYFSSNMSTLFDTNSANDAYTCVHNYFNGNSQGAGYIESVTDESNSAISFDKLNELKGQVASWIATNTTDCYSVSDVIAKGNSDLTSQLMAVFTDYQTFV